MVRVGLDGRATLVSPVVAASSGYRYTFETQP
jgi:hypothetical protein